MNVFRLFITVPQIANRYCDEYGVYYDTPPAGSTITDSPLQFKAMELLRDYRNQLLTECDYTQLPDVPLTPAQVARWRVYRQALRDYPKQVDMMAWSAPPWPVAPW